VIGPLSGPPRYIFPVNEPSGSVGTLRLTVPSSEPTGHSTPNSELWILAWAGVQASRPCAAEGSSVIPSGNVIVAVLTCDWATLGPSLGIVASVVISFGASGSVEAELNVNDGAKGTCVISSAPSSSRSSISSCSALTLQPFRPIGVV
jgi:hypothetical protein